MGDNLFELEKDIKIKASPETIWNMMVKHQEHPDKEPPRIEGWEKLAIKDLGGEPLTEKRKGLGVRTRWHYKFFFYPFSWDDEVIKWDEKRKIEWKAISDWDMVDSFTLDPVNDETRVIYRMEYTPPYGMLGKIWYKLIVHRYIEKHIDYILRNMKENAERIERTKASK